MRSLTAGLVRQAMVAAAMAVLLFAGLSAQPGEPRRAAATATLEKPIATRAIVIAEAPTAEPAAVKPPPAVTLASASKPARQRLAAAPSPRPRPADPAPQQVVAAAYVAPAPQADRPFDLRKRLFAPVGFVRDNVARLISWL